ncbi:MAG: YidC/Oxa1 family membrane protein insertase [Bifidobacteriaceae bacterium]|jgi:YidC/Oxa1 family membrane protein insertase|nr:YidC/Oxa1 family membrane protein insertase [Bifidobacteriaceae bacterium]
MEVFNTLFGVPLGYLLYWCHAVVPNYGAALILFTLATKAVLFPLSLLAQRNAVTMVRIRPRLDDIKRRFEGNNTQLLDEQKRLYKRERYSSFKGMVPMLIQIPIILGLINVIYKPLQHLLHTPAALTRRLVLRTAEILDTPVSELGYGAQLRAMEQVQANPAAFADLPGIADQAGGTGVLENIGRVNLDFFGMDLAQLPSWSSPTIVWPVLSALSALALCLYQNRYFVLNRFQSPTANWAMTIFMVAFSGYFALVLPCGLGLYWTAGNLLSIAVVWLGNLAYPPEKHADLTAVPRPPALTREQKAAARAERSLNRAREKRDADRFQATPGKQLMIYSESSGYWKYFRRLVEWLLANTGVTVHYVTSDPADKIFGRDHPRLQTYYIGQRALISFMMKLDVAVVLMTLPDLEIFHIKRSLVRPDAEYIYLDHGMTSLHLMLREHALDHFDTVFAYGPNHIEEIRRLEELSGLPAKRVVVTGYGLLDDLIESVESLEAQDAAERPEPTEPSEPSQAPDTPTSSPPPVALIAPSWQIDNLIEVCLEATARPLVQAGFRVVVRPHPEFVKRFPNKIAAAAEALSAEIASGQLELQTDFSSNFTVYTADVVVTDWSTIAQEFSYATLKPAIFVNTPMKVMNPNWEAVGAPPLDITLRDMIGVSVDTDDLPRIGQIARELVASRAAWRDRIKAVLEDNIYYVGSSELAMGEYILEAVARTAPPATPPAKSPAAGGDQDRAVIPAR